MDNFKLLICCYWTQSWDKNLCQRKIYIGSSTPLWDIKYTDILLSNFIMSPYWLIRTHFQHRQPSLNMKVDDKFQVYKSYIWLLFFSYLFWDTLFQGMLFKRQITAINMLKPTKIELLWILPNLSYGYVISPTAQNLIVTLVKHLFWSESTKFVDIRSLLTPFLKFSFYYMIACQ